MSSPSTVAARTIAETMNTDSSLNEILMAKVNRLQHAESFIEVWMEEAKGIGDNRNEEKIKVYNNTNWEYEVEETKEGSKMLITDQALPEDKATSEKFSGKALPEDKATSGKMSGKALPEDKATSEKISSSNESKDPLLKELIEKLGAGATEKQLQDLEQVVRQINDKSTRIRTIRSIYQRKPGQRR